MNANALITDQSIPFACALADALGARNVSVALTVRPELSPADPRPATTVGIPWNRPSSLSAKTVVLECLNAWQSLDQAVVVFDGAAFALQSAERSALESMRIVDEFIKGHVLIVRELIEVFTAREKGRLVFAVRPLPPTGTEGRLHDPAMAAAEAAFMRLAEEVSASLAASGKTVPQTLLVNLESGTDAENALWLADTLLQPMSGRNSGRWVKAGSRGLFGKL